MAPKKKVFILSYCWNWLSERDKDLMLAAGCPIVVLQATDNMMCKKLRLEHCGPGLFIHGRPPEWRIAIRRAERTRTNPPVLYTENLLQQRGYKTIGHSTYLTYYRTMKPMGIIVQEPRSLRRMRRHDPENFPWLVTTLADLQSIHSSFPQDKIYFAPIGEFFSGIEWVSEFMEMTEGKYVLPARTILSVSNSSPLLIAANEFPHHSFSDQTLFYSSMADRPLYSTYRGFLDVKGTLRANVVFVQQRKSWSFVHSDQKTITLSSGTGIMTVDRSKMNTRAAIIQHLSLWAKSSDLPVEERIIRDFLREVPISDADAQHFDQSIFDSIKWLGKTVTRDTIEERDCGKNCIICRGSIDIPWDDPGTPPIGSEGASDGW